MKTSRPYAARAEYIKRAVARRRRKVKTLAIEYKGGQCTRCGYDRCEAALEFHHRDRTQKDFGLSADGLTRSWERTKKELDKCVLLCSNCHKEEHATGLHN